jgi:hypothetical protein
MEIPLPQADTSLRNQVSPHSKIRLKYVLEYLFARTTSSTLLRFVSIETIVRRLRSRKERTTREKDAHDTELTRHLAMIYNALQLRYAPSDNTCLLNSLAMMRFFAIYDIYPDWIFGVRIQPFAAHCWVQNGSIVLNDSAQNVISYSPVLSV